MLRNSFLLIFLFLFLSHRTYSELLPLYGLFLLRHCIVKYTYFLPASSYIYCKHSSQNRRLHAP